MIQHRRLFLWLALLLIGLAITPSARAEELLPPFGLRWGETAERLERLLRGAKANIVERRTVEGREAWEVEGLIQTGLKRTVFYFLRGELVEVELQYQKDDWIDAQYDSFTGAPWGTRFSGSSGPPARSASKARWPTWSGSPCGCT